MTTMIDTAAIESLRSFAEQHGEIQFAHLCTAALQGEGWAIERMREIPFKIDMQAMTCGRRRVAMLTVIRATDTTRPDGAIARAAVEV